MMGRNRFRGAPDRVKRNHQYRANKQRRWRSDNITQHACMGHGAHGALMAGKLGIVSVNVGGLHKAGESHRQNTDQRQRSEGNFWSRLVSVHRQS